MTETCNPESLVVLHDGKLCSRRIPCGHYLPAVDEAGQCLGGCNWGCTVSRPRGFYTQD